MKVFSAFSAIAATSLITAVTAAVDPIVIKGSKFFYKTNGTQFFIQGVAYQQDYLGNGTTSTGTNSYIDPLADATSCARDIPYLLKLRTNTIRVYAVDPTQNHDQCMNMLANAGIYVIADLGAPGSSIDRNDPTWNTDLYSRYTSVIDALAGYTNTLGFFAGNEVANAPNNTDSSAFAKAAVRDMKAYIKQRNYRTIGVGYATNDDPDIRVEIAEYFDCGNSASSVDFWGYNIYSWCGDSSYVQSGYNLRTAQFANYNIPVFFAEYGCNTVQPRTFSEVAALFGSQMTPVWSGGIVYMYFQEVNDYGLVTVSNGAVSTLGDFNAYSTAMASISPASTNSASYTPTNTAAQACPTINATWGASSVLPPVPNAQLCNCMYSALSCVPNNVNASAAGTLFGTVCGLMPGVCAGIASNGTTGSYGAYEMCSPSQQLGWVLDRYYQAASAAGNGNNACNFGGSASLRSTSSIASSCSALIVQAGPSGTASVTALPSLTGSAAATTGQGGSGTSSTSKGAAPAPVTYSQSTVMLSAVVMMTVALISGSGMILL